MLTIGSCFSGVGGLELGLETAGLGPVLWQCEADAYRRSVLARHWPDAMRFPDVRSLVCAGLPPVALLCGGFPCQDVSSAGTQAGLDGARSGLWYEFARIVEGVRPAWVVVENVASGAHLWVDAVRGELERLGYATLPVPISASDCGALHRRARVFIVAHAHNEADDARAGLAEVAGASKADGVSVDWAGRVDPEPDLVRVVYGLPGRVDGDVAREAALGDSVVPACAEVVGWVIRELIQESRPIPLSGIGGAP